MLNLHFWLIPALLFVLPQLTTADEAACNYLERHEIERRLSTKTPYRAIANYNETPPFYDGMLLLLVLLYHIYKILLK